MSFMVFQMDIFEWYGTPNNCTDGLESISLTYQMDTWPKTVIFP